MSFEPIRRILPGAIQAAGIGKQVTATRVLEVATSVLIRLWGEERAAHVHVISFTDGVLKISASIPAALQELKLWETQIQNEINRSLGTKVVRALKFMAG